MNLPKTQFTSLQLVTPQVLLITINRPAVQNALHKEAHDELSSVFDYCESEPAIRCVLLTGAGERAFCAGMDIKHAPTQQHHSILPPTGFGGFTMRRSYSKPVIAIIQGYAYGGGLELALACDIIIATERAAFSLPEVKRGLVAASGGLARLVHCVGYQRAMSICLTGRTLSAREAKEYGIVNDVTSSKADAIKTALVYAKLIGDASPDAIKVTKYAIQVAMELPSVVDATQTFLDSELVTELYSGDNLKEGLAAFREKRLPVWSKL
jgi:enoyl-CoA hydratase/carnithine racemase